MPARGPATRRGTRGAGKTKCGVSGFEERRDEDLSASGGDKGWGMDVSSGERRGRKEGTSGNLDKRSSLDVPRRSRREEGAPSL